MLYSFSASEVNQNTGFHHRYSVALKKIVFRVSSIGSSSMASSHLWDYLADKCDILSSTSAPLFLPLFSALVRLFKVGEKQNGFLSQGTLCLKGHFSFLLQT